jgi:uncharacterized protein YegL
MRVDMTVLLDKSGSMGNLVNVMRQGFDKFMQDQKGFRDQMFVSLYQFNDSGVKTCYERLAIDAVPPLELWPMGTTPLLDSVGDTIVKVSARIAEAVEDHSAPDKVIFMVITDGGENESTRWTKNKVQELVKEREADNWEFLFLGANIDSFLESKVLGVQSKDVADFDGSARSVNALFDSLSNNIRGVALGEKADMGFSEAQRRSIKS